MKINEHTRNQKRMYRIHKMEEQIDKDKYIIGRQKQEIDRLNNVINELEKWLSENTEKMHNISGDDFTTVGQAVYQEVLDKLKELKENE